MRELSDGSACTGQRVAFTLSVLVDFQQVALDGFGPFARVVLDPSKSAILDARVIGLPLLDGSKHVVTVITYQGDGLYTEAPPGFLTGPVSIEPISIAHAYYGVP